MSVLVLGCVLNPVQGAFAAEKPPEKQDVSGLSRTMIPAELKKSLSAKDLAALQSARELSLIEDSNNEAKWEDERHVYSGSFQIQARYTLSEANAQVQCRKYIHTVKLNSTNTTANDKSGKPMQESDVVCLRNNKWSRFKGDSKLLVVSNAPAVAPAAPAQTAHTAPKKGAQVKPDHVPVWQPAMTKISENFQIQPDLGKKLQYAHMLSDELKQAKIYFLSVRQIAEILKCFDDANDERMTEKQKTAKDDLKIAVLTILRPYMATDFPGDVDLKTLRRSFKSTNQEEIKAAARVLAKIVKEN
jgi:hypothetical protein